MYGKLVHRPPFGHHYHAPRPPFGEPREVGERYLGHPELTDYWIKPYLLEALKHYPRLDDECVVEGLWKFANTICLQNKHTSIRTPPTYDDPVTTHKIAFLDKDDIELGCIKFWRKVDSTFGIDMILNGRGISITGNNDDPTLCLVDTPIGDNKKQIVNIEYLEFSLSALQGLVDGLTDRIGALEDYKGQADSLIRDPNGNFRTVHTAIHNDSDDQNIPTCYAVYQYGKGISDALNGRIDGLANGLSDLNNALNGLSSRIGSIANDVANLQNTVNNLSSGSGGGSGGDSGGGSGGGDEGESTILYYQSNSPYLSGTVVDAAAVTLGRSFDGMNISDTVSGSWVQTSEAVSVPSAGSGSGAGRPTWRAHFSEMS